MRIVLVISSLAAGGAQRVLTQLATELVGRGHEVRLVTLDADPDFYVAKGVDRVRLGLERPSQGRWDATRMTVRRLRAIRATVRAVQPDVVLSFMDNTNLTVLLALTGTSIPVVVSERIDPRQQPIGRARGALRRWLYRRAASVVVQTTSVAEWARSIGVSSAVVIPNPVQRPGVQHPAPAAARRRSVIGIGRLVRQKGFDLLLRAFASIAADVKDVDVMIIGDGPERDALHELARREGLIDRVRFVGTTPEIGKLLSEADVFVLSSRFEGFPNVLLEAMAHGRPVVAFDCPSGPGDIVTHGYDGFLVPPEDVDALAAALRMVLDDGSRARLVGSRAADVVRRFDLAAIVDRWEQVLVTASGTT